MTSAVRRGGIIILLMTFSAASIALGLAARMDGHWGTNKGRVSKDGTHWRWMISVNLGKGTLAIGYQKVLDVSQATRSTQTNWPWWQYTVVVFEDTSNGRYYQHWSVNASSEVALAMGVVFGICPTFAILRGPVRRRWRRRHGRCTQCGYDLTGNVSGVCPECGRNVAVDAQETQPVQAGNERT